MIDLSLVWAIMKDRHPGAPPGNRNAVKAPEDRRHNVGRITADFGPLKARCVGSASKAGKTLTVWLMEAAEEKLAREQGGK